MRYKTSYDFNEKSMESYFMTDEYVERRRAYVNEIRRSFDRPEVENGTAEEESQPLVPWIISDNQYYTILQDYVMINEHD